MDINILCPGKLKDAWLASALEEYEKRVQPYAKVRWDILPEGHGTPEKVMEAEAMVLERRWPGQGPVYVLAEEGLALNSPAFARLLADQSRVSFIIGGAWGLLPSVKARATRMISLAPLTFTHQLVRLVLLEQIYRGFTILAGKPYHH